MPYLLTNSDGTLSVTVQDGVIDTASYSLALVGRQVSNYGQYFAQNTIRQLENFASTSPPAPQTTLTGQLWYDKTEKLLRVYDGQIWKRISGILVGPQSDRPTTDLSEGGTSFFNTTTNKLEIYNGSAFKEASYAGTITSEFNNSLADNNPTYYGTIVRTLFLKDTNGISNPVIAFSYVKATTDNSSGANRGTTQIGDQYETIMALISDREFIIETTGDGTATPVEGLTIDYSAELIQSGAGIASARGSRTSGQILPGLNVRAEYEASGVAVFSTVFADVLGSPAAPVEEIYVNEITIGSQVTIQSAVITTDLVVGQDLYVDAGDIIANSSILSVANLIVLANTTLQGETTIEGTLTLDGIGVQELGDAGNVIENAYIANVFSTDVTVTGTGDIATADIATLNVSGLSDFTGNVTASNINVDNNITTDILTVQNAALFNNTATFQGAVTFNSTTNFGGSANIVLSSGFFVGAATQSNILASANTGASQYIIFADGASGRQELETSGTLRFVPSTGILSATGFTGWSNQVRTALSTANTSQYLTFVDSNNPTLSPESIFTAQGITFVPSSNTLTIANALSVPTISATSITDGVATLTAGSITGIKNITGDGTGNITAFSNIAATDAITAGRAIVGSVIIDQTAGDITGVKNITGDGTATNLISGFGDITISDLITAGRATFGSVLIDHTAGDITGVNDLTGDGTGSITAFSNIAATDAITAGRATIGSVQIDHVAGDITGVNDLTGDGTGNITAFTDITGSGIGNISGFGNLTITSNISANAITDGVMTMTGGSFGDVVNLHATGQISFGSLETGNVTIEDFVDSDEGMLNYNNNDSLPTTAAVLDYIQGNVAANINSDSGSISVVLYEDNIYINGTANEIETSGSGNTIQIGLPDDVTISRDLIVSGNLLVSGNTTTVNTEQLTVEDYKITVNSLGAAQDSGFEANVGGTLHSLLYSNSDDRWTIADRAIYSSASVGFIGTASNVSQALSTGNGLEFSSGTSYTGNDARTVRVKANSGIIANVNGTFVDHDAALNFVSNEHIDHSAVSITAGSGLTGGGDITTSRTLNVGAGTGITVNADDVAITATGVTAGTYGNSTTLPTIAINDQGQITSATNVAIDHDALLNFVSNEHIDHSSVTLTAGSGLTGGGDITTSRTFTVGAGTGITVNADNVAITATGVTAGSYGNSITVPTYSVNSQGQLTAAANVAIDHDALLNFVSNEHIDHSAVSITAGSGLTGGGNILASRTLNVGAGVGITVNSDDVAVNANSGIVANVNGVFAIHDSTVGFVTNEHVDHSAVNITAGAGLTGGGDLTTTRTLNVGAGDGIVVNADNVSVSTSVVQEDAAGNINISGNINAGANIFATTNVHAVAFIGSGIGLTDIPTAGTATNITITKDEADTETFLTFVGSAPVGTGQSVLASTGLKFNASTNALTSSGSITATGTVQGGTLTDGTLSINSGNITSGVAATFSGTVTAGAFNDGAATYDAGTITGGVEATFSSNVNATYFNGTATSALYADLAEIYASDSDYEPGTVVKLGGSAEITQTTESYDQDVFGVISTDPAFLMNSAAEGLPVAFTGRVPIKVIGSVKKGERLVSSHVPGHAVALTNGHAYDVREIIGRALEAKSTQEAGVIEAVIGVK